MAEQHTTSEQRLTKELIRSKIRTVPHWPKQGVMFRDITTLLQDAEGLKSVVGMLVSQYNENRPDVVAGIEARGFIIAGILAHELGVGFVPLRKKGKLPFKTESQEYALEYGTDRIEIHVDAIGKGEKVLLIDDLIATGGTALAACRLIEKLGGIVQECAFIIDLPDLGGKRKLEQHGYNVFSIVEFAGD
ncbi:MAG: adenine phosphoribosyltransferase [Nanoarchaeota archaeon]